MDVYFSAMYFDAAVGFGINTLNLCQLKQINYQMLLLTLTSKSLRNCHNVN